MLNYLEKRKVVRHSEGSGSVQFRKKFPVCGNMTRETTKFEIAGFSGVSDNTLMNVPRSPNSVFHHTVRNHLHAPIKILH